MQTQTTLNATLQDASDFSQRLENQLSRLSINDRTAITLAIQELLVNIVLHSYEGQGGQIDITMSLSAGVFTIEVRDYSSTVFSNIVGTAPDPLDLPEHGMGLFIIQQSFDTVNYTRDNDVNLWQLVKQLEA